MMTDLAVQVFILVRHWFCADQYIYAGTIYLMDSANGADRMWSWAFCVSNHLFYFHLHNLSQIYIISKASDGERPVTMRIK